MDLSPSSPQTPHNNRRRRVSTTNATSTSILHHSFSNQNDGASSSSRRRQSSHVLPKSASPFSQAYLSPRRSLLSRPMTTTTTTTANHNHHHNTTTTTTTTHTTVAERAAQFGTVVQRTIPTPNFVSHDPHNPFHNSTLWNSQQSNTSWDNVVVWKPTRTASPTSSSPQLEDLIPFEPDHVGEEEKKKKARRPQTTTTKEEVEEDVTVTTVSSSATGIEDSKVITVTHHHPPTEDHNLPTPSLVETKKIKNKKQKKKKDRKDTKKKHSTQAIHSSTLYNYYSKWEFGKYPKQFIPPSIDSTTTQAAIVLQRYMRGWWYRWQYQIQYLSHRMQQYDSQQTPQALQQVQDELQQQKQQYWELWHNQSERKHQKKLHQTQMAQQEQKQIIQHYRLENKRLRETTEQLLQQGQEWHQQQLALEQTAQLLQSNTTELQTHYEKFQSTHQQLLTAQARYRDKVTSLEEVLERAEAYCNAEHLCQVQYRKRLGQIVSHVQDHHSSSRDDEALVTQIVDAFLAVMSRE